jgi:hypothetical protein
VLPNRVKRENESARSAEKALARSCNKFATGEVSEINAAPM